MATVLNVRQQLNDLCERVGVAITSYGAECSEPLRKALLSGLFTNVAEHRGEGKYHAVRLVSLSHAHTHTHTHTPSLYQGLIKPLSLISPCHIHKHTHTHTHTHTKYRLAVAY